MNTVPYGSEVKIIIELDGATLPAESDAWIAERVAIRCHDDLSVFKHCWVPAAAVRRADDAEHYAALREQYHRVARRLGAE